MMKNYLQLVSIFVVFWLGFISISNVRADIIPYPDSGKENEDLYNFTATSSGQIQGYFYESEAAHTSTLTLLVNGIATPETSGGVLNNHSSNIGDFVNLGSVHSGDALTFQLNVLSSGDTWYSDKSLNTDGLSHIYSTSFPGDIHNSIPSGILVGFEDLPQGGDFDYNDDTFALTNVSVSPIPEPETYGMLLAGLGLISFYLRGLKTA